MNVAAQKRRGASGKTSANGRYTALYTTATQSVHSQIATADDVWSKM